MSRYIVFTDSGTYAPVDVARLVTADDDNGFAELSDGERNTFALLHGDQVVDVASLSEDQAISLYFKLRNRFDWTGTIFVEGDITGMLDPDCEPDFVDPRNGEPLSEEQLAAIAPQVVENIQSGYYWRKSMQDRLAEVGNEILSDAVGEAIDEVLRG